MTDSSVTRRQALGAAGFLPLVALAPGLMDTVRTAPFGAPFRFFTPEQAATVDAATRRLVPGPEDDPREVGHPGAAEARVVRYIDTMLGLFSFDPPRLFTGGPWSDRPAGGRNHMARFTDPDPVRERAWRRRIKDLQDRYTEGIARLDAAAGGRFATASASEQDAVLASADVADVTDLLFGHTIEGMYANPEYGGNHDLTGWREIGFPGDRQPVGWNADEMSRREASVLDPDGVVASLVQLLGGEAGAAAMREGSEGA